MRSMYQLRSTRPDAMTKHLNIYVWAKYLIGFRQRKTWKTALQYADNIDSNHDPAIVTSFYNLNVIGLLYAAQTIRSPRRYAFEGFQQSLANIFAVHAYMLFFVYIYANIFFSADITIIFWWKR